MTNPKHRPLRDNTLHFRSTDTHDPARFETEILISEWTQAHALDRAFTGIGRKWYLIVKAKQFTLQAWTGSEGSRRLRLPDFKTVGT